MTKSEYQELRATTVIQNAVINVTDNCNLRCPYCFTEANERTISLDTMKSAIQFLCAECTRIPSIIAPPRVYFFGGEPMLQVENVIVPTVDWVEQSGIQKKYGLSFGMTTNGTLLTEENLTWMAKHGVEILLSIDGDRPTQDSQRPGPNGKSSFDMLSPKLSIITKHFPSITFRSTIEPYNAGHLYENYLFAKANNFKNYFVTPNTLTDWSQTQIEVLLSQSSLIAKTLYEDISHGTEPLVWTNFVASLSTCFSQNSASEISFNHCGIGTTTIGISTDGGISGCQEHNTYTNHDIFYIGDIYGGINEDKHRRLLSAYNALSHPVCKENPSLCKSCSFYDDCANHFCPSHNLLAGSTIMENSLVTCIWNGFIKELAFIILELAVAESNSHMMEFLKHNCGIAVNLNHSTKDINSGSQHHEKDLRCILDDAY